MFHLLAAHGVVVGKPSYETDRTRFLGRGRTAAAPVALEDDAALSGSEGSVLEPIVAIRCQVALEPGRVGHASTSCPAPPIRARRASHSPPSTRTGTSRTASSTSPGPTAA